MINNAPRDLREIFTRSELLDLACQEFELRLRVLDLQMAKNVASKLGYNIDAIPTDIFFDAIKASSTTNALTHGDTTELSNTEWSFPTEESLNVILQKILQDAGIKPDQQTLDI